MRPRTAALPKRDMGTDTLFANPSGQHSDARFAGSEPFARSVSDLMRPGMAAPPGASAFSNALS